MSSRPAASLLPPGAPGTERDGGSQVLRLGAPVMLDGQEPLGGQGGVAHDRGVWRGQPVFVKTCLLGTPDLAARFAHEGRVLERLGTLAPVPLLAATPTQLLFPLVRGGTLRDRLELGPLAPAEALGVTLGLLDTLEVLHACGIVHHDLKPENVLLVGGVPARASARLVDFGLSHLAGGEAEGWGGLGMGTPHYMAPEQFQGQRGDPRSDLYSAGALLYDCLLGSPPYADALGWLSGQEVAAPDWPAPEALGSLLRELLARDPRKRPQSAAALRTRLEGLAAAQGWDRLRPMRRSLP